MDSVFRSIGILARLVANERTRHYSDLQKKIAKLRSGTTPASSSGGGNSSTIGLPLAFTKRSGKSTQTDAVLPSITQQRQEQQQQSMDNNSNHSTEATASEASAKIAALSKDLVYYKSTNKELKRKMRQLVAMNNQLAQVAHGVGTRHESGGGVGGGGKEEESAGAGALRTSVGVY